MKAFTFTSHYAARTFEPRRGSPCDGQPLGVCFDTRVSVSRETGAREVVDGNPRLLEAVRDGDLIRVEPADV
ncbi:hypothetical protein GCM10010383_53030 [Streptomyces lomondensis]|uniref:Uncharacterized protein n=1 Tax=Streptomyces lomondensis TaxID=68229 RepID=A0ABQ2XHK6_9ACTN|nr:hypothetical protein GCM10010383_53030 [Streptomyces lomondensis]